MTRLQRVREHKGTSLVAFPKRYVVLDIETTGLDPRFDEIIEISALRVIDHQVVDRFSTLVKPARQVDAFITALTGITNRMLATAPKIVPVLEEFFSFIGDDVLVGYNVHFDINFLYDSAYKYIGRPLANDFIDVMRIARRALPDLPNHKQISVAEHFQIDPTGAHRAERDCLICLECFLRLQERIIADHGSLEAFPTVRRAKRAPVKRVVNEVAPIVVEFDEEHPLFNRVCVFTGALEKMTRSEAMQLVVDAGGSCGANVTPQTNYLVLANASYLAVVNGQKSSKWRRAEELKLAGATIEILSEDVFYELLAWRRS